MGTPALDNSAHIVTGEAHTQDSLVQLGAELVKQGLLHWSERLLVGMVDFHREAAS